MSINIPETETTEVSQSTPVLDSADKPDEAMGASGLEEIDFGPIKRYFDIDSPDSQDKESFRYILKWAHEQGAKSDGDIISELKRLEIRLGAQPLGERRLPRLLNYLKLDSQIGELIKQQRAYVN